MVDAQQTVSTTPATVTETFDAIVVGAGFSGLYMLHQLRKLGLRSRVFEAGSDVGGTWYWNRYPGARCDSESIYYMFSDHVSEELLQEWSWSERYAAQPEILRYLQFVADRLDLRRDIQFNTRVIAATYDEANNQWLISTDNGNQARASFLITAVGCLSAPNLPKFKGLESFKGTWYHTGNWPHDPVSFSGQRVAVVGTGATGVQVVPEVAREAAYVYVFQRTPNYNIPARNRPLDAEYIQQIKSQYREIWHKARISGFGLPYDAVNRSALSVSPEEREQIYWAAWNKGGFYLGIETFSDLLVNKEANETASEFIRARIRELVYDPKVAELLIPRDHHFFTKRPPLEHGYYEAFNRDNVTLIDVRSTPIEEITPQGIRTSDTEYEADAIIFATGFDAMTGSLFKMNISGRDGITLNDKWADGPRTYLGLATHGFPNMFMITGPQSPSVLTNMTVAIEQHVEWITDCINYLRSHGVRMIEAQAEAEEAWVNHATQVAEATLLVNTPSWWVGANIPGKPRLLYPYVGGLGFYKQQCDEVAANGYRGFALQR